MEEWQLVSPLNDMGSYSTAALTKDMAIFHTLAIIVPMVAWIVWVYLLVEKSVVIKRPLRLKRSSNRNAKRTISRETRKAA